MWRVGDGHYRVAVGYDDNAGVLILHDPWDRDDSPQVLELTYGDFCTMWDYTEHNLNQTAAPFYAALLTPWRVDITLAPAGGSPDRYTVSVTVSYDCPDPFCSDAAAPFPATQAQAELSLPPSLVLGAGQSLVIPLGTLTAGDQAQAQWWVQATTAAQEAPQASVVVVTAKGLVTGSVPAVESDTPGVNYPAYTYTDWIGGVGFASM